MTLSHTGTLPSTYGNRFYNEHNAFSYAYGNTPARDFLEYAPSDVEEPSVLALACGDIRSCFYTVWKNFSAEFEQRFTSLYLMTDQQLL